MKYQKTIAGIFGGVVLAGSGVVVTDNQINPYTDKGTTLSISKESTLPEGKSVETQAVKSEPKIILKKWNGEVSLGVKSMDLPSNTTGSRPLLSKNVEWQSGKVKMEAVPIDATTTMEDGGMEINIILNSAPSSNVFTFQLDNWQNLDFFYQPALTAQDIKEGANRPDNVVGSYAVYYKDHANHIEGQTNYATGKAYHIYRPLVTDNKGNTVWADLSYDNGVLIVTVPQDFLLSASYPVKVDPTFGYTSQGVSDLTLTDSNADRRAGMQGLAVNGTLTLISSYLKKTGAGTINGTAQLFSEASSKPNASLVGPSGNTPALTASYVLYDLSLSFSMVGTNYWATVRMLGGAPGTTGQIAFDSAGGVGATTNDFDVWTANTNRYSVYATYTATPSTPIPTIQIR